MQLIFAISLFCHSSLTPCLIRSSVAFGLHKFSFLSPAALLPTPTLPATAGASVLLTVFRTFSGDSDLIGSSLIRFPSSASDVDGIEAIVDESTVAASDVLIFPGDIVAANGWKLQFVRSNKKIHHDTDSIRCAFYLTANLMFRNDRNFGPPWNVKEYGCSNVPFKKSKSVGVCVSLHSNYVQRTIHYQPYIHEQPTSWFQGTLFMQKYKKNATAAGPMHSMRGDIFRSGNSRSSKFQWTTLVCDRAHTRFPLINAWK